MSDLFDDVEFTDSHITKIPVLGLCDVSGSMGDDGRIEAMNDGMEQLRVHLSADTMLSLQTDIGLVGFNDKLGYQDFCSGRDFKPPRFSAKGGTLYVPAIHFALDMLDRRTTEYQEAGISFSRPILIMITDGNPHDSENDLVGVRKRIVYEENRKHCAFYTMGMADADMERLSLIAPPSRPPKHIGGAEGIAALIKALSRSLTLRSRGFDVDESGLDPLDSFPE